MYLVLFSIYGMILVAGRYVPGEEGFIRGGLSS